MEIKVGMWIRWQSENCYYEPIGYLEQIKKIEDGLIWTVNMGFNGINDLDYFKAKTANNPWDLLEVGDLIKITWNNGEGVAKHILTLPNKDDIIDYIKRGKVKLVEVVPHENINWQEVNYGNTAD